MSTYIILLRGINVSGQKKIPMADLRQILIDAGFNNVQTYIQSGNVVLEISKNDINIIQNKISDLIKTHFGFVVPVLVKTSTELQAIFDNSPFKDDKLTDSYFTLLHQKPSNQLLEAAAELSFPNEEFKIEHNCVYFYSCEGYGRAKGNNNFFERKLKVTATTRNYKTMLKLLTLSA